MPKYCKYCKIENNLQKKKLQGEQSSQFNTDNRAWTVCSLNTLR